jgi:hypothetical protein
MAPTLPPFSHWRATCETLHAHTQVLGKLAVALAPAEPQLQHGALRLSARGLETLPLPAADRSGSLVLALELHEHEALVEHSAGRQERVALTPNRCVGEVTRELLAAVQRLGGPVQIDPTPQEVSWTVPLDEDDQHRTYDPDEVSKYFAAATEAALALAAFRAPYRGRSTPVNAWWGSFDLAVSLFSGRGATPPSSDFIMRNAMDSQEVAVGWWPGDERHDEPAFYAYLHPSNDDFPGGELEPPGARWDQSLSEYVLPWRDVCGAEDPHAAALAFMRSAFQRGCELCDWDPVLAGSAHGEPPPVV